MVTFFAFFAFFFAADVSVSLFATDWLVACIFVSAGALAALPAAIAGPARSDATRTGTDIVLSMGCPFSFTVTAL